MMLWMPQEGGEEPTFIHKYTPHAHSPPPHKAALRDNHVEKTLYIIPRAVAAACGLTLAAGFFLEMPSLSAGKTVFI